MEVTHKPGEAESLKLYAKAQALLMKVYPTLQNYPRVEHHQLCATIKHLFAKLLEHIALAKYATSVSVRMAACKKAAGVLQNLTTWYELSSKRRYIKKEFFEEVDADLTELKKILAGFMKAAGESRRKP